MMKSPSRRLRALLATVRRDKVSRGEHRCEVFVLEPLAADLLFCPLPWMETGVLQLVDMG